MEKTKIKKDPIRKVIVAARLTVGEHRKFKKICKEQRINYSRFIRFSIEEAINKYSPESETK
jgi:hypothetical protein